MSAGGPVPRYVCQFSCGAASAVAAKLILAEVPDPSQVLIVNAFIAEEHADNRRFAADAEVWLGHPIIILAAWKYKASTDEVWRARGYFNGPHGAPCSGELKRKVLAQVAQPGDVNVLGYTAEEEDRLIDLQQRFPDEVFRAPLLERGLSKEDCLAMVERAGLVLPLMYRLGYDNANCIGCPKGGQAYWQNIRADFPERFLQISTMQQAAAAKARECGNKEGGPYWLRFRSGPRKGERMSLAELPAGRGDMRAEPSFSCSFLCALAEQEWRHETASGL